MAIIFPPLDSASPEGLLAVGGMLDTEILLTAYKQGIFPWPISHDSPLTWFSPDPRGVLMIDDFHLSKSFNKFLKTTDLTVRFNHDFSQVIDQCCKTVRKHESGTWITKEIITGYEKFFDDGYAYSVEVYHGDKMVGGLYGVVIGHYISGESMFHLETNASKLAIYALISTLKLSGISWIDTQMVTPVIESLGGKNIPRNKFIELLQSVVTHPDKRDDIFGESFSL